MSRRCGGLTLTLIKRRADGTPMTLVTGPGAGDLQGLHLPPRVESAAESCLFARSVGETLEQFLGQEVYPAPQALKVLTQAAAALNRFHARPEPAFFGGIPPGALIRVYGDRYVLDPGFLVAPLTSGPYAAPEAGWQPSPAADVYSLGAILYHALIGSVPTGPVPYLSGTEVPTVVRALLTKAMAPDPVQRYPDAGTLWMALDEAYDRLVFTQGVRRSEAARTTVRQRPARRAWRPPAWAWAVSVGVGALTGLGVALWLAAFGLAGTSAPPTAADSSVSAAVAEGLSGATAPGQPGGRSVAASAVGQAAQPQPQPQPTQPQPTQPQPTQPQPTQPQPTQPQPTQPQPTQPQPTQPQPTQPQPQAAEPPTQQPPAEPVQTPPPADTPNTEVWVDGKSAGPRIVSLVTGNYVYILPRDFQRLFGIAVTYNGDAVKLEANGRSMYTGLYHLDPGQRLFIRVDTLNLRLAGLEFRGAARDARGTLTIQVRRLQS